MPVAVSVNVSCQCCIPVAFVLCANRLINLFHIVGACDQTWSSGEGYEDQDPGGNLSVFSANQGTKVDIRVKFTLFYFLIAYGS